MTYNKIISTLPTSLFDYIQDNVERVNIINNACLRATQLSNRHNHISTDAPLPILRQSPINFNIDGVIQTTKKQFTDDTWLNNNNIQQLTNNALQSIPFTETTNTITIKQSDLFDTSNYSRIKNKDAVMVYGSENSEFIVLKWFSEDRINNTYTYQKQYPYTLLNIQYPNKRVYLAEPNNETHDYYFTPRHTVDNLTLNSLSIVDDVLRPFSTNVMINQWSSITTIFTDTNPGWFERFKEPQLPSNRFEFNGKMVGGDMTIVPFGINWFPPSPAVSYDNAMFAPLGSSPSQSEPPIPFTNIETGTKGVIWYEMWDLLQNQWMWQNFGFEFTIIEIPSAQTVIEQSTELSDEQCLLDENIMNLFRLCLKWEILGFIDDTSDPSSKQQLKQELDDEVEIVRVSVKVTKPSQSRNRTDSFDFSMLR